MSTTMSLLTRVRVLLLALAILAGGFAALAPQAAQEAEASHVSLMTVRGQVIFNGKAQPNVPVRLYNENGAFVRSTVTDAYGNFGIVAGRDHSFYLMAYKTWGTSCAPYGGGIYILQGYSNWFYLSRTMANPQYVSIYASFWQHC